MFFEMTVESVNVTLTSTQSNKMCPTVFRRSSENRKSIKQNHYILSSVSCIDWGSQCWM